MILNRFKLLFLFFTSLLFFSGKSYSQDNDTTKFKTDVIKVFSNKVITDKFNSPTTVQFITSENIENKNGSTLSDALQLAGGIFIKSYGGAYSLNTVSSNGLGAEHTLVLLNGFKLNSTQNNQIDLSAISKDNIERIEVLNNGSSSIYGSEAISGVVNVITKNSRPGNFELKLNGELGSYEQKKIYLDVDKNLKTFNIDLNYSKESSLNNYKYYFDNGIEKILKERANSNYDVTNYSVNMSNSDGNNFKISYYGNYSHQQRSFPGIETGSAPSNSNQLDQNWNNILTYDNLISKYISVKSQINFQNNLSNYTDKLIINSYYKNSFLSNLSQLNYIKNNFELITGYEINYAALKSNETDNNIKRIQPGIFVISKVNLNKTLKLFPSARYDYISDLKKNVLSGKIGINFKPFENRQLNFKASIGNNFAAPTFNELYWKDLGNKNLKPESSLNVDAGAIYGFNLFTDNVIEVTYSYIDAKDKIVWSPNSNGLWTPENIGKSVSNVILVEANFKKELLKNFTGNLGITYSYTQSLKKSKNFEGDPTYEKQIFYIPEELSKFNLSLKYKETGLNFFYIFTGKRYTDFENINYLPATDLFEGNIFQNVKIYKVTAQIKFEVNNIFNANYEIISGYPMPLRNYKMVLNLEY